MEKGSSSRPVDPGATARGGGPLEAVAEPELAGQVVEEWVGEEELVVGRADGRGDGGEADGAEPVHHFTAHPGRRLGQPTLGHGSPDGWGKRKRKSAPPR